MSVQPPANPGMTVLDRSKFTAVLPLAKATLNPRFVGRLAQRARPGELLNLRGVSRVLKEADPAANTRRTVLFAPGMSEATLSGETRALLREADAEFGEHTLELGYEHWTSEEVLKSVLPADLGEAPTGFTVVGHIAHFNLRDRFLPYKHIIGQVMLDKNPAIRTVVNKLESIHAVYRNFDMEVIAGVDNDFWVEQHESGCRFQFDFSKVYWNSRLHSEHERLVALFPAGEAVCDPFAGVGPFAVPAAKKHAIVFANDLNPDSFAAMEHNVELNRVRPFVTVFNEDGRAFIRQSARRLLEYAQKQTKIIVPSKKPARSKPAPPPVEHAVPQYFSNYVMNLPDTAIEFLDAFRGLYAGIPVAAEWPLPTVHVHCFFKHDPHEPEPSLPEIHESLAERVSRALGHTVPAAEMGFHDVRKVAPTKEMFCVSFQLPREVAFAEPAAENEAK